MTTRRAGELSVKVDRLELLAKSIRPLPDKWHGLADPDTRFRQRYADLVVNADAARRSRIRHGDRQLPPHAAASRASSRSRRRSSTSRPGGAHARPFVTHYNTLDMPLYLRIASSCTSSG